MVDLSQRFTDWREQVKRTTPTKSFRTENWNVWKKLNTGFIKFEHIIGKKIVSIFFPKFYVIVPTDQDNERCEKGF